MDFIAKGKTKTLHVSEIHTCMYLHYFGLLLAVTHAACYSLGRLTQEASVRHLVVWEEILLVSFYLIMFIRISISSWHLTLCCFPSRLSESSRSQTLVHLCYGSRFTQ